MLEWLHRFRIGAPKASSRDAVLNDGLALAMDWGENWLSPIQSRLVLQHPQLAPHELDALNAVCQGAMRFALETIHSMVQQRGKSVLAEDFSPIFLQRYPWASSENTARLFGQGLYYAWKTGGPAGKA
jgi:hypothetical protein